jgi:hypothetical protein
MTLAIDKFKVIKVNREKLITLGLMMVIYPKVKIRGRGPESKDLK